METQEISPAPNEAWEPVREALVAAQQEAVDGVVSKLTYDDVTRRIQQAVFTQGQFAGAPMPRGGFWLEIAPGYPFEGLGGYWPDEDEDENDLSSNQFCKLNAVDLILSTTGGTYINDWHLTQHGLRFHVVLYRDKQGRVRHRKVLCRNHSARRLTLDLNTLGASLAWDMDAEERAMETLREMVTPAAYRYYRLVGGFLETSRRSGIMYWFRRCKPTLALSFNGRAGLKPLAALCLHPIAYYLPSHAGAMVPTDDVIAHLTMMRANEHTFWKRANQHDPAEAEAAV